MSGAAADATQAPAQLGRFELRHVLGRGAQATVWLGFDPRLEREVAVKLLRPAAGQDAAALSQWLQEARNVSRLTHPNIVPVFEADMHEGRPYLVFEFVPGRTLAEHLRARGALPPREAVEMMLGMLDALHAAHVAGVVHRDLKPSNVLVDGSGRGRVMDFGIAARTSSRANDSAGSHQVVGTPGYMSPEAANGQAASPTMDVFAAGLVLVEMLHGQPLIMERDPYRAIYRAAHEDLSLPASLPSTVDDALRDILLRSIARDTARRPASAAAFRDALQGWLVPAGTPADASPSAPANSGTLDFLLRRMRHKSDFPALSDSVVRIQRIANSDSDSVGALSNEILTDVALTNKLLRLVNTAHYAHAGGGTISTVSRAVALIGFAGIRNMALSLMLLEHMQDKSHANQLKDDFLRALMAGTVAGELGVMARESEEAFIGAMFLNLGRLLTEFYFPEEARQIRALVDPPGRPRRLNVTAAEDNAATSVLGLSFQDLGLGVAKSWGLPESLQRCMRRPTGEVPTRFGDKPGERLRWLAQAANEITDALMRTESGEGQLQVAAVAQRYAIVLGVGAKAIEAAAATARSRLAQSARALNIHVLPNSPAARLIREDAVTQASPVEDSLSQHALKALVSEAPPAEPAASAPGQAADVMAAGIQDITNSMVDNFRLNEVLRMILETMLRALDFRCVVFCLRDPKTDTMTGRFGLGEGVAAISAAFKLPLKGGQDMFSAVCIKGADTLISDSTAANIAARLPSWFRSQVNAPSFLLLPLMLKGAPFALIYADKTRGAIHLDEKELALLRTLRNQAVMAFRQSS